ncbi:hypothetical protein KUTeg_003995 [Tegillarca granosa]|uniref:Zasp-like motif domain-containing protein n=1 Tax=Tegillarca granosa TaxID=220873 RepID=A0ABQ9FNM2_TEGGR|nr:hypothetical protein KUTeg_003995 [Tegillarca granosa]
MTIIRAGNDMLFIVAKGAAYGWNPTAPAPASQPITVKTTHVIKPQPSPPVARQQVKTTHVIKPQQSPPVARQQPSPPEARQQVKTKHIIKPQPSPPVARQQPGGIQRGPSRPTVKIPKPQPKAAVPNVVHAQYNSPMGLYSAENIADSYAMQTRGIQKEMQGEFVK